MNQPNALLNAMRAAASLGDSKLDPAQIEALAAALGIDPDKLPELVSGLQRAGKLTIAWGGKVEVLPEQDSGGGPTFNFQGASLGHGAVFAVGDAHGGTVYATPEAALNILPAIIMKLQSARPGLKDEAADAADKTIEVLAARPTAGAPSEIRQSWASSAASHLGKLLAFAPDVKDVVELGQEVIKAISGT